MGFTRGMLLLFLLASPGLVRAADPTPPPKGNANEGKGRKKKRTAERLDLNQIDLEQVEEDWDSTPAKPSIDVGNSVKIREIVEPSGEYSYASFGRPDPFASPAALLDPGANEGATQNPEGREIKMTSILQRYPLSDLNVKGVWQVSSGEVRAVILTPKSEGVVVKEGDPISSGKVLSIKRDQLLVRLYRLRTDGVREYEDVPMKIGLTDKNEQGVIKLDPGKDPVFVNPEQRKPMPTVPLSKVLDMTGAPAGAPAAVPAANAPTIAPAGGSVPAPVSAVPASGMPAPIPVVAPVEREKGLDPVVPRAPK